jgi:hypothetical protein
MPTHLGWVTIGSVEKSHRQSDPCLAIGEHVMPFKSRYAQDPTSISASLQSLGLPLFSLEKIILTSLCAVKTLDTLDRSQVSLCVQ